MIVRIPVFSSDTYLLENIVPVNLSNKNCAFRQSYMQDRKEAVNTANDIFN